jgi:acetyltransferase-like isoleucine patch superfamily enzyme
MWFMQKVLGFNRQAYWPMHFTSKVNEPGNILVGIDTCPGYEPGCYIQGLGRVIIGDYTAVAQNVGIISANHLPENPNEHDKTETTIIGSYCWIGMNAVILPGVHLGDFTVVGAGSVVTKSFPDGHCIIAGNPARKIRDLLPENCVRHEHQFRYVGYLRANDFDKHRKRLVWF